MNSWLLLLYPQKSRTVLATFVLALSSSSCPSRSHWTLAISCSAPKPLPCHPYHLIRSNCASNCPQIVTWRLPDQFLQLLPQHADAPRELEPLQQLLGNAAHRQLQIAHAVATLAVKADRLH